MFRKHIIFLATILLTLQSPFYCAAEVEVEKKEEQVWIGTDSKAKELLSRKPIYTKEDTPQATVGVVPYTIVEGEIFILLGREMKDKAWCDFGGKLDASDISIEAGIKRELREETAGSYNLKSIPTEGSLIFYINKRDKREIIYAVFPVEYFPESTIMEAIRISNNASSKEKDEVRWLSLKDFITFCKAPHESFPVRKFFYKDFVETAKFESIIHFLMEQQNRLRKAG